jgi:hypothetical protein
MGSRYLVDLADVCRATGWPVIEVDGWQTRARGSGGYDTGRPTHVMAHHTASGPSSDGWDDVNYCTFGDDDAPLANLYLSRDGTIYVCAGGATNTNGSGQDPCGVTNDDAMNSSAIGIEAGNGGTGEPWPPAQTSSYTALCAALCHAYGISASQVHSHAEWAPDRKVDPYGPAPWGPGTWDMDGFRADLDTGTPPTPPPPEEDDDVKHVAAEGRGPMIVGAGWRRWARNEHDGGVMAQLYGPPQMLTVEEYDLVAEIHTSPSDGAP